MSNELPTIGILGAGQLGKMLALAAHPWDVPIWMLDRSANYPGGVVSTQFVEGDFKNYDNVLAFGRQVDIITVEIEHVNTEALQQLKAEGKTVHPDPDVLETIKDKGLQKLFYKDHQLPTSPFHLFTNKEEVQQAIQSKTITIPFVQKSRQAGYDGKGVAIIRTEADMEKLLPGGCVIEPLVDIEKEIAVVVARNPSGDIAHFEPVEMQFHPTANLVELLFCPAALTSKQHNEVIKLAHQVIDTYAVSGLLAVEFFLTKSGQWLINEVAPRPHNSGHHTIDSCVTSQFEQHLRAILNWPLGDTTEHHPAAMINLLGADGHTGPTIYEGLAKCLALPNCHFHLYGKKQTRPFRKMGHATALADNVDTAINHARKIKKTLKIISNASS